MYFLAADVQPLYYTNFDLESVISPVDPDALEELLLQSKYNPDETKFLVDGFRKGFDIGFQGKIEGVRRFAPNLRLRIGNVTILWNKIMKEVKLGRFVGPFDKPPFADFIQSPVGLVPKDGGKDTRLIFHLSYPRVGGEPINSGTPKDICR